MNNTIMHLKLSCFIFLHAARCGKNFPDKFSWRKAAEQCGSTVKKPMNRKRLFLCYHFVGKLSEAFRRSSFELPHFKAGAVKELCGRHARAYGQHRNACPFCLFMQSLAKEKDERLGSRIYDFSRSWRKRKRGCDIDDCAMALFTHNRQKQSVHMHQRKYVQLYNIFIPAPFRFLKNADIPNSGIVHQALNCYLVFLYIPEHPFRCVFLHQIKRNIICSRMINSLYSPRSFLNLPVS